MILAIKRRAFRWAHKWKLDNISEHGWHLWRYKTLFPYPFRYCSENIALSNALVYWTELELKVVYFWVEW